MKYILYIFILLLIFAFSQVKETITDSQGNISNNSNIEIEKKNPERLLDIFYKNQEKIKELDRLINYKFY